MAVEIRMRRSKASSKESQNSQSRNGWTCSAAISARRESLPQHLHTAPQSTQQVLSIGAPCCYQIFKFTACPFPYDCLIDPCSSFKMYLLKGFVQLLSGGHSCGPNSSASKSAVFLYLWAPCPVSASFQNVSHWGVAVGLLFD